MKIKFDLYSPQELRDEIDFHLKKCGDAKTAAYLAIETLNQRYGVMQKASQLEIGTKMESEHKETVQFINAYFKKFGKIPSAKIIYQHIAKNHLDENKEYYKNLADMEKDMDMQKAQKNLTKLIKKQITDKTGRVTTVYVKPEGSKTEWLNKFVSFFGFSSTAQVNQRIEQDYKKLELDKKGVTWQDWKNHVSEYFSNKDKWDKFFTGKASEKKETEKKEEAKAKKAEKKPVKQTFKLSLMRTIAGLYGKAPEKVEEGIKVLTDEQSKESKKNINETIQNKAKKMLENGEISKQKYDEIVSKFNNEPVKEIETPQKQENNFDTMSEVEPEPETPQKKAEDVKIVEAIKEVTPENRAETEAKVSNEVKQEWAMTFKEYRDYLINYKNQGVIGQLERSIAYYKNPERLKDIGSGNIERYKQSLAVRLRSHEKALREYLNGELNNRLKPELSWDYLQREYDSMKDKEGADAKALKRKLNSKENKAKSEHERLIKNAIKDGKVIPANVLKEYPEIQKDDASKMTIPDINYKPIEYKKDVFIGADPGESNKRNINISDYSKVPPKDVYLVDEETILNVPRPSYIPEMDLDNFMGYKGSSQTFDVVRLGPNKYIIVDKRYPVKKSGPNSREEYDPRSSFTVYEGKKVSDEERFKHNERAIEKRDYYEMNAETLAATWDYYRKLFSAKEKQKFEEKQDREEAYYNKQKQKTLDSGKEWKYAPFKRKGTRPTKPKVDAFTMSFSQAFMIQDFTGIKAPVSEFNGATKMNMDLFANYQSMLKELEYKINDLRIQNQYNNENSTYKKGQETAYGDSGTKPDLLESKGVLVKRQNGTEIDDQDIAKIGMMIDDLYQVFGDRSSMSKKYGLKISYAGEKRMHASKAIGMFVPDMKCIAVSNQGIEGRGFTVAHEYAHFMDAYLGETAGYNFLSDEDGSIANTIASTFRKDMNLKVKPNEKTAAGAEYYNRTCECFARAMEQYYAIKQGTEDILYEERNKNGSYIDHDKFMTKVMPLCEQFLLEKNELLKAFHKGIDSKHKVFIKKYNSLTGEFEYRKVL